MKNNKKTLLVLFLVHLFISISAPESDLIFSYDDAGNIIERKIQIVVQGRLGKFDAVKDSSYQFKIFPNPTNQYLNIEGPLPKDKNSAELTMFSVNGQIVRKDNYNGDAKVIPVDNLKPGIYILEIRYSKEDANNYKIIITN
jgi:hypothetical protein